MSDDPRDKKVLHAATWVSEKLVEHGGPRPETTAVLVIRILPVPNDPEMGMLDVSCLPDMHQDHLIEALEKFLSDLKAGKAEFQPFAVAH